MSPANQRQESPKGASPGGRVLEDITCRSLAGTRGSWRASVERFASVCESAAVYRSRGVKVRYIAELLGVSTHCVYRALRRGPLKTDGVGSQSLRDATKKARGGTL